MKTLETLLYLVFFGIGVALVPVLIVLWLTLG